MSKACLGMLGLVAMISMGTAPLFAAEEPRAKPEDLILRVGDKIKWTPQAGSQHRLRFDGTVTHNGSLQLTKFTDVQKVLKNFNPPPPAVSPDGAFRWEAGVEVTAEVQADTGAPAVTEFFFTCGFQFHPNQMVTATFKIEPAIPGQQPRNIEIISAPDNAPLRWVLRTTPGNAAGDRSLIRP